MYKELIKYFDKCLVSSYYVDVEIIGSKQKIIYHYSNGVISNRYHFLPVEKVYTVAQLKENIDNYIKPNPILIPLISFTSNGIDILSEGSSYIKIEKDIELIKELYESSCDRNRKRLRHLISKHKKFFLRDYDFPEMRNWVLESIFKE